MSELTIQELWSQTILASYLRQQQQDVYWLPVNMESPLAPSESEVEAITKKNDHSEG